MRRSCGVAAPDALRAALVLVALALGAKTQAQAPSCEDPAAPRVVLRASDLGTELSPAEILRHLAAGFAGADIAVCAEGGAGLNRVVEVELAPEAVGSEPPVRSIVRIRMQDAVTHKILERSVDLAPTPRDSRAVLIALYIEELVQASWIEISMKDRVYLREHPGVRAPEVQREISEVLPDHASSSRSAPRFVLSFGGALLRLKHELIQIGPELTFGWAALPWLWLSSRLAYRMGPPAAVAHGTIDVQTLSWAMFVAPVWPISAVLSLHFPQGIDAARVRFTGRAEPGAQGESAVRYGVLVSHAVGARIGLTARFAFSATARFCWTLLRAEAADDGEVVTGLAGLGGEGSLSFDTQF